MYYYLITCLKQEHNVRYCAYLTLQVCDGQARWFQSNQGRVTMVGQPHLAQACVQTIR